jgi:MFS family permease
MSAAVRLPMPPDLPVLFATRSLRMAAYGAISVILVLYLSELGLGEARIGLLLTLTLLGDTGVSLFLTTHADRLGRKRTLMAGAGLMLLAGVAFALSGDFFVLLIAATIGVISPSGYEVGPFLAVEQACLSEILPSERRTHVFAWYNLSGSFATAFGALGAGALSQALRGSGATLLVSYRAVLLVYAVIGIALAIGFVLLSGAVEAPEAGPAPRLRFGLGPSRPAVIRLSALFSLDAFAGGFVVQSLIAYWFHARYGLEPAVLGSIFFGTNLLAGISALLAARLSARFGLINTMVFTHMPSNLLLIAVPLMPNLPLAIAVLLLRYSISQMDVPTRQSYTMGLVGPEERSAAAGVTGIARTTGAALSPSLSAALMGSVAWMNLPFILAGGLKLVYDVLLYRGFRRQRAAS